MRSHGLTLIELMVTLSIAGVLAATAVTAFSSFIVRHRVETRRDQLFRSLRTARYLAAIKRRYVTTCSGD
jgi:type IV fimbrial biogenesis protein FimT